MFSILFIYLFVCFWSDGSEVKKSRSSIGNGFLLKFAGLETIVFCSTLVCVCVCVTFLCCQSVFICSIQVQNTPQGKCTPTHTHTPTHTILSTRTYPSSTAATQQMCRAGFNFLAPRLMHFSSRPSCSHPATPAAQCYWLAIKPSNSYKELNILKLLHLSTLLTLCTLYYSCQWGFVFFQVSALMQYQVMNVWCNADDSRFFFPSTPTQCMLRHGSSVFDQLTAPKVEGSSVSQHRDWVGTYSATHTWDMSSCWPICLW